VCHRHHPSDIPSLQCTLINTNTTGFLLARIPKLANTGGISRAIVVWRICPIHHRLRRSEPSAHVREREWHQHTRLLQAPAVAYEHSMAHYRAMRNPCLKRAPNCFLAAAATRTRREQPPTRTEQGQAGHHAACLSNIHMFRRKASPAQFFYAVLCVHHESFRDTVLLHVIGQYGKHITVLLDAFQV